MGGFRIAPEGPVGGKGGADDVGGCGLDGPVPVVARGSDGVEVMVSSPMDLRDDEGNELLGGGPVGLVPLGGSVGLLTVGKISE